MIFFWTLLNINRFLAFTEIVQYWIQPSTLFSEYYNWVHIISVIEEAQWSNSRVTLVLVTQSCPALCNPMDCTPPGSTVHGLFQARIHGLPFPSPEDLPNPGIKLWSHSLWHILTIWAIREAWNITLASYYQCYGRSPTM